MDWREWRGKRIFVKLKDGSVYSGKVNEVDDKDSNLIFINITDKFGEKVTIVHSEIIKIKEEGENG
jgi:small nuclear ribonucleoprotein (snRNP)-like protein